MTLLLLLILLYLLQRSVQPRDDRAAVFRKNERSTNNILRVIPRSLFSTLVQVQNVLARS